jgi:hypothetical protein
VLRAEESRARFEYIRSRADAANEQDMVKREELERRLQVRRQQAANEDCKSASCCPCCQLPATWLCMHRL